MIFYALMTKFYIYLQFLGVVYAKLGRSSKGKSHRKHSVSISCIYLLCDWVYRTNNPVHSYVVNNYNVISINSEVKNIFWEHISLIDWSMVDTIYESLVSNQRKCNKVSIIDLEYVLLRFLIHSYYCTPNSLNVSQYLFINIFASFVHSNQLSFFIIIDASLSQLYHGTIFNLMIYCLKK
jgi:hypothetical protein